MLPKLRHLKTYTQYIDSPLPGRHRLTHLALNFFPARPPDMATAFPALTHFFLEYPRTGHSDVVNLALRGLPRTLTHFATGMHLDDALCASLPDRLQNLSLEGNGVYDLPVIRARWFAPAAESGVDGNGAKWSCHLASLTLLTADAGADEAELDEWPRARAAAEEMRQAGCRIEYR